MDVELLISLVRQNEFLYDVTNRDYKNVRLKTHVWNSIGKELNETGDNARLKWKTVRDGYMKYKKQAQSGSGKKLIEYVWSGHLNFLDNYQLSKRKSHYQESEQCEDSHDETAAQNHSPEPLMSFPMLMSSDLSQTYHLDQEKFIKNLKSDTYDATDHLFLSYSQTFKKFPPREQALLKIELAKLFANSELKQLNEEVPMTSSMVVKRECDHGLNNSDDPLDSAKKRQRND